MQIIKENVDSLNAILKLKVTKEDYAPKIKQSLIEYRKKVELKGFRKGQVPLGVIKKMYGNQVVADTVNDILNQEVNNYIVTNKLDVLGNPLPKHGQTFDLRIDKMDDFEFEYEIGLAPEFELTYLKNKPTLEREVIDITTVMLDEEVERIRKRYGKVEEVTENMQNDDMLTIRFEQIDEKDEVVLNGIDHSAPIALNMLKEVTLNKQVMQLKKGDSIIIRDLVKAFEKEPQELAKQILNLDMTPEKLPEVKATLEEIKRVIPAEVNEDFFKTIYGEDGEVKTELEMRAKIQEDIEQHFSKQTDSKLYNKLAEALIENTKMDFPSDFLKRWIKLTNENPITEEQIEKEFPAFEKNLKWSLIVKKVSKENKVDVSTDEVKQRTADQIRQQMTSYGIGDMPPDEMDKFVSSMMARKDHSTQTRETLLEEKLFVYFKGQINTKDKKISLEEFNKQ